MTYHDFCALPPETLLYLIDKWSGGFVTHTFSKGKIMSDMGENLFNIDTLESIWPLFADKDDAIVALFKLRAAQ